MLTTWKQADVFPIIAQVIRDEYAQKERFVTHDEIIARLLAHPEAVHLIGQAHEQQDKQRPHEWLAHNMVAWFSERITVGQSDWANEFIREKIDDKWAYKPQNAT